jgi:UTP-glucose-1-phosphate uridylyltransferase
MTFSDVLTPLSAQDPKHPVFTAEPSSILPNSIKDNPNVSPEAHAIINALQDQIISTRKAWRLQLWELESQLREMRTELEEVKKENCKKCGASKEDNGKESESTMLSVVDRPRVKTGGGNRALFGTGWVAD